MGGQNLVKEALESLRSHFRQRLLLFPPISSDALERLIEMGGRLPTDLIVFLKVCNGLRIDVEGNADVRLWGTPEVMACAVDPCSSIVPRCFLPLRGDPTGGRDWIITECEPALGAIVRWDPWTPAIKLLASSLGHYLVGWTDYLKACYGPDGEIISTRPEATFGNRWIKNDVNVARLGHDPVVAEWLSRVAEAATCDKSDCGLKGRKILCGPMHST